jgi:hypothetical protein
MQQPKVTEVHRLSPHSPVVVSAPAAQQQPAQGKPQH